MELIKIIFDKYIKLIFNSVLTRGQVISVLIAGTGVFATLLSDTKPNSSNYPTLMSFFNYILLSTYLIRLNCSRLFNNRRNNKVSHIISLDSINSQHEIQEDDDNIKDSIDKITNTIEKKRKPLYWYFGSAVLDLEANYLVILAYNYTTITSIMLLDCFTIPSTMVLSYFFLSYRYTYKHILGVVICILGLVCIVITDSITSLSSSDNPNNALLGDMLCLFGSILYASSNVLQEHIVKCHNREEYMGILGGFGSILSFIQFMILDFNNVKAGHFTYDVILYIFGFVSCLFCMYANTSVFLISSDSTLFNLSLLTSDVYAVIFSYFMTGQLVHWAYFISFGLVIIGLYIYHNEKQPIVLGQQINNNIIINFNQFNATRYALMETIENPIENSNATVSNEGWKIIDNTNDDDDTIVEINLHDNNE